MKITLQEVIDNLEQTIVGKRELLSKMETGSIMGQIVNINIEELERIKADLSEIKE